MQKPVLRTTRFLAALTALVLAVSACSTSQVATYAPVPDAAALARASDATAAVEAPTPRPAPTKVASALEPPRPVLSPAEYPNINKVPERPKTKVLTEEEKAKVVAELEALAKAQGVPVSETAAAARAACDKAVAKTLDPEKTIKKEGAGQDC